MEKVSGLGLDIETGHPHLALFTTITYIQDQMPEFNKS